METAVPCSGESELSVVSCDPFFWLFPSVLGSRLCGGWFAAPPCTSHRLSMFLLLSGCCSFSIDRSSTQLAMVFLPFYVPCLDRARPAPKPCPPFCLFGGYPECRFQY